jgi:hypothetical protein
MRKEESSFSEEKEAKRLFSLCARPPLSNGHEMDKSFLVLFFKKEPFALGSSW